MLHDLVPEFLYPISRQFPFDKVSEQIIRELEKRNWEVPGLDVEFYVYGTGAQKFRHVSRLRGEGFLLWFCRVQRLLPGGRWNDVAAVSELIIPGKQLNVYEDESGPTLYVYVGSDWEKDKGWFCCSSKVNTKLNGEPRRHLEYHGRHRLPDDEGAFDWYLPSRRPRFLYHDNDLGREYDLKEGDPLYYLTKDIMEEFRLWMTDNVLNYILTFPEQEMRVEEKPQWKAFPTELIGSIFTYGEGEDVKRIIVGKTNPLDLEPCDRYGLIGNGLRLVPLDARNDGTVPKIAYDGFTWCAMGEITNETKLEDLPQEIGRFYRWSDRDDHVIRVMPKFANDIYIIDMAVGEKYRQDQFKTTERLSDEQLFEYYRCSGRTIIPISEYIGGFEKPVILVNRELDFDEVEVAISSLLVKN